jgi:hypothetical protein
MKVHMLLALLISLGGAAAMTPALAANLATDAGLVAVQTSDLDQLYVLPHANLAGYRKVLIDPASITFRKDFNKTPQDTLAITRRLTPDEVQQIADDTAASLHSAVAQAFTAQGYEVVTTAGPGVLRLSPSAVDLFVNAPDARPNGQWVSFTQMDDGEATLVLEAHDAVSGTLLSRAVDHRHADKVHRLLTQTSTTAENFWFENMFRQWGTACAKQFEATTAARISFQTQR